MSADRRCLVRFKVKHVHWGVTFDVDPAPEATFPAILQRETTDDVELLFGDIGLVQVPKNKIELQYY